MPKHRSHSAAFKRQVAEEFLAGETLHGLLQRHDISRQLIRIWIGKFEAGALDVDAQAADSGNSQNHKCELYLAVESIDHTRTKAKSLKTNGICERFNKTILTEFYQVALRKKLYRSIAELQADLDAWMREYNTLRTHQGRWCYGKTPRQAFVDMLPVAKEKLLQVA